MKINKKYNNYNIELFNDDSYTLNSADNKYSYDFIYNTNDTYQFSSKHAIIIKENDNIISSAILLVSAGATTIHDKSYCLENNNIIICAGNYVFSLAFPSLKLNWKTEVDRSTAFQIFSIDHGFIIHGELDITRIDKEGNIIWQRSGSDIFVTESGVDDFIFEDNCIKATSWDNRKYKFNLNGEEI